MFKEQRSRQAFLPTKFDLPTHVVGQRRCFGLVLSSMLLTTNAHSDTCGIAVIKIDGVTVSTQDYCYADGFPGAPPGGGPSDPGHGGGGGGGGGSIGGPAPSDAVRKHADACAVAYSAYHFKQGAPTNFLSYVWGWAIDPIEAMATSNNKHAPPSYEGYDWVQLDANTFNPDTAIMYTDIYVHSYSTIPNLINTLAHEYAHQNGIDSEKDATAIGDAAQKAYETDGGAKCAGR